MRIRICLVIALSVFFLSVRANAAPLELGAKLDTSKLIPAAKKSDNTIIAFVPSLTYDCDYASMLTRSFFHYFDQKHAFDGSSKTPLTQIVFVVADYHDPANTPLWAQGGMLVVYDKNGELFANYGANLPVDKNSSSTVVLLDSDNKVVLIDTDYRAQGEHLKPLEHKLKELNEIKWRGEISAPALLKIGDKAPDFEYDLHKKISGLKGEVVLVSFYPAAFSGTFPRPEKFDLSILKRLNILYDPNITSCSFQIDAISTPLKTTKAEEPKKAEAKKIVVSASTPTLLSLWSKALATADIVYANDPDYSVASKYSSYNAAGYHNRVSVIIDKKGKIAYIDESFQAGDEIVLKSKLSELLAAK